MTPTNFSLQSHLLMPPSKHRSARGRSLKPQQLMDWCPCVSRGGSVGVCDLNVWLGTTLDDEAAGSGKHLLRPNLPVIKDKYWIHRLRFPGHLYHLVSMGWIRLLCIFVGVYVGVVGVFALLFAACHGMNQESPGNARNFFNLSLQTLSSIGYGSLYPGNTCSRCIQVLEALVSMLMTSFMTGIAFVKFARPHPNIELSDVFTVSRGESGLAMRFRVANKTQRDLASKGDIIDTSFKLILMRVETGKHEEKRLCYYDLKLLTSRLIALRLEVELVHVIDGSSPFFNQNSEDIMHSDLVLILIASGLDENLHDMVHKKHEYGQDAMRWGAKFVPMLDWDAHHKFIELDLDKLSSVTPVDSDDGGSVNLDIRRSWERDDEASSSSSNEPSSERSEHSGHRHSKSVEAEETTLRKVADSSFWELGDDYDKEAIVRRISSDQQTKGQRASMGSDDTAHQDMKAARGSTSSYQDHGHDATVNLGERPMSLLQRRARVRNRSHNFLSNGMYQRALGSSWPVLLLYLVASYVTVIATIALLISVSIHEPLEQSTKSDFASKYGDVFFFCVQTISTVGYGSLSPRLDSDAANFFVFLLVFSGLFVSTLLTGVTWAKFSIPKASTLLYSNVLLLTSFHSQRAVMFRAANNRKHGVLVEGSFRMSVVVLNRNFRRRETHELQLVRNVWPIVNLCNTLTHIIDESSPLFHLSTSDLLSGDHFFVVLFTGLDDVISDNMVARKAYHACDILVNHHFEDNITLTADGLYIDLDAINATYCDEEDEKNISRDENAGSESSERDLEAPGSMKSHYERLH